MKIVWAILLGMFIFQGLFVVFGTNFFYLEDAPVIEGVGEANTTGLDLQNPGGLWSVMTSTAGTTVIAALSVVGIGIALMAKNYAVVAIVMFLGFMSWLYLQTVDIFVSINNFVEGGEIVLVFITLFNAVIAILVIKEIISMLAPGGVD